MKNILFALAALILSGVALAAQQSPNVVTIDVNQLPENVKQQITQQAALQETKANIARYGEWVGLGKELGGAIDGGLTAVEKHVDKIADTKVGTFTMALIAYKVVGRELIHFIGATVFFFMWFPFYLYIIQRNVIKRRVLEKETFAADGKTIQSRTFETVNGGLEVDDYWGHAVVFFILIAITCSIAFTG